MIVNIYKKEIDDKKEKKRKKICLEIVLECGPNPFLNLIFFSFFI
jgi:hypothetical protein